MEGSVALELDLVGGLAGGVEAMVGGGGGRVRGMCLFAAMEAER